MACVCYLLPFPAAFYIFCFSFCHFNYSVFRCIPLWVNPICDFPYFLDSLDCFLSHVRKVFSYYIFKYIISLFLFLFSFWDGNTYISAFYVVPEVSSTVLIAFHSLFFSLFITSDFYYSFFQLSVIYHLVYTWFLLVHFHFSYIFHLWLSFIFSNL